MGGRLGDFVRAWPAESPRAIAHLIPDVVPRDVPDRRFIEPSTPRGPTPCLVCYDTSNSIVALAASLHPDKWYCYIPFAEGVYLC